MKKAKYLSEFARELGRKGGNKNKEKGKKYFSTIGKKGAEARWSKPNPS